MAHVEGNETQNLYKSERKGTANTMQHFKHCRPRAKPQRSVAYGKARATDASS